MTPDLPTLYAAIDATWPAAATRRTGPWTIRTGQGGGSRVSAATAEDPITRQDIAVAEQAMIDLAQTPLFMIRAGDDTLDAMLSDRGYRVKDPVRLWIAPTDAFAPPPPVSAFAVWPPLASQADLWADGGIGPARLAIMDRAEGAKTTFLGRADDAPKGTVFVACDGAVAMLHALEVASHGRRRGVGRSLTAACAVWARAAGARHIALLCTKANVAANALYASMGFQDVGHYHYRLKDTP